MKQLIQWKVLPLNDFTSTVTSSDPSAEAISVHLWHMVPNSLCRNTSYILSVMVQSLHKQKLSWFPFAETVRGHPMSVPTQWGSQSRPVLLKPHTLPQSTGTGGHTLPAQLGMPGEAQTAGLLSPSQVSSAISKISFCTNTTWQNCR